MMDSCRRIFSGLGRYRGLYVLNVRFQVSSDYFRA